MDALDRPVWATLNTYHRPLSVGNSLARRFGRNVNVFASAREDDSPEALAALAALVEPGESVYLAQVPNIVIPPGLVPVKQALAVQMLATTRLTIESREEFEVLGNADAPEMLALATLTEPGPFLSHTHTMGRFIGTRIDGRLAAMAGERMRFPGYTEVSGVCTHPDFRGRGLARRLSAAVTAHIVARGDQPFLHSWKTNSAAIDLYRSLGFEIRSNVNIAQLAA